MAWDCTALWRQSARNEVARHTRHLTPAQQRVAKAFVSNCTVGGQYYWSQERLGRSAHVSRQRTNAALRRLGGGLDILHIPVKQRHYNHPKTISLRPWFLTKVTKAVRRALSRSQGDSRKAKAFRRGNPHLPSLAEMLRRFPNVRRYSGGYMVCCPAHCDRHPSLSLAEGRGGRLLMYCHAGCAHEKVREALHLPPPKVTLGAASGVKRAVKPGYRPTAWELADNARAEAESRAIRRGIVSDQKITAYVRAELEVPATATDEHLAEPYAAARPSTEDEIENDLALAGEE
jgi:hypothetical protein